MDKLTFTTLAAQKIEALKSVIEDISLCLKKRFESFSDPIYESMSWLDPANWNDTEKEVQSLLKVAGSFHTNCAKCCH